MVSGVIVNVGTYIMFEAISIFDFFVLGLDPGLELGCECWTGGCDSKIVCIDGKGYHLVVGLPVLEE